MTHGPRTVTELHLVFLSVLNINVSLSLLAVGGGDETCFVIRLVGELATISFLSFFSLSKLLFYDDPVASLIADSISF